MADELCEEAVLHFGEGVLTNKKRVVPAEIHLLGAVRLILDFPDDAAVTRSKGTSGDGWNYQPPDEIEITFGAYRLAMEKLKARQKSTEALWLECIREDLIRQSLDLPPAAFPPEALKALKEAQEEQPKDPVPKKCPAHRNGVERVKITIERPVKAESAAKAKPLKSRKAKAKLKA